MCIDLKVLLGQRGHREGEDRPQSAKTDKTIVEQISLRSILWRYDMFEKLKAYYHHTASSSVLVHGDYVYVCTGNGRSWVPGRIPYSPLTPSLVVFHKMTGQLVARDDEQIGEQLYRGQYTSPSLGMVNGRAQILFATGNGVCYAFEPVDPAVQVVPDRWMTTSLRGPIVYFIDVEGKDTGGLSASEYARSIDLLSSLPKPALPLEFRFSRKVPATTPVDTIPTATVPDVPAAEEDLVVRLYSAGLQEAPLLPAANQGRRPRTSLRHHRHSGLLEQSCLRGDRRRSESRRKRQQGKCCLYRCNQDRRRHGEGQDLVLQRPESERLHRGGGGRSGIRCGYCAHDPLPGCGQRPLLLDAFHSKRCDVLQFAAGGGWEGVSWEDHPVGEQEIPVARWHQERSEHGLQQPLCCQRGGVCRDRRASLGHMRQGRSASRVARTSLGCGNPSGRRPGASGQCSQHAAGGRHVRAVAETRS